MLATAADSRKTVGTGMPFEIVIVSFLFPIKFTSGGIIIADFIHRFGFIQSPVDHCIDHRVDIFDILQWILVEYNQIGQL
jgi:hypothetical protein